MLCMDLLIGKRAKCVADAGDIVHIDVVEFRQLDEALDRDAHFALFVVGIGGLGNMDSPRDLRLVEVVVRCRSALMRSVYSIGFTSL